MVLPSTSANVAFEPDHEAERAGDEERQQCLFILKSSHRMFGRLYPAPPSRPHSAQRSTQCEEPTVLRPR